ncbi:double-strand break repair helicase AddA [Sphingomonas jatrophae]|uniref:DNA 3'-5' helicase n=1 Tax=Sphingomonas jatrophae TaxID=1166337 RepID=A0A1I6KYK9_9SPHN|nr:double-strand break repair helicase AddA [Sphingomonas jatrophae]SFR96302.1 DNA helicase/exodeoxyribonuclease V, subunit A [Sphingomonas jatrophae]
MARLKPLIRLQGAQLAASHPGSLVWLSASAGTGKTHVLTARVLRLLLAGTDPGAILCLTFTKAGAAEMAQRLNERLAYWVRLEDSRLREELWALGEDPNDPRLLARARTLFARVLEAGGGGLRIQTIHAFCQTLLAGFPAEAGLAPGFRPLEGREEAALARSVLAEMLVAAEAGGDLGLGDDVARLSRRLGEQGAEAYLVTCARDPEAMAALGSREGIGARLRHALGLPLGDIDATIHARCGAFDEDLLRSIAAANAAWATKQGLAHADVIAAFLAADAAGRALLLSDLLSVACVKTGEPRKHSPKLVAHTADYGDLCSRLGDACREMLDMAAQAALADLLGAGLRAGQAYAAAYDAAKRAAGLVDFDDLIRTAVRLLGQDGIGDWIRYKLDQATDHILVDEAQDTNARQWAIVAALASDYFAGEGARGDPETGTRRTIRTIFTVGDFKQAIFGFQGTDPQAFRAARQHFERLAEQADRPFQRLGLSQSFRSTPPVLELVDRLLDDLGADTLGIADELEAHRSAKGGPGTVTLWRPFIGAAEPTEEGEEGWVDDAARLYAATLARQIAEWLKEGLMLESQGRPLRPEDVLVLVRKRGDLASLLVARLHAEGVPVAGVDRLRLDAPLAVQDLLAAMRFAVQPEDDLTLAALLVSPLFGWDQDRLYRVAFGRPDTLWRAVREAAHEAETAGQLRDLLARADLLTPHRFLEHILSGPLEGRRRILARLGEEARDPVEELVSAAVGFEAQQAPSLQRFLQWFDGGEVEIKRDPAAPLDAVRVMTVHGAKGLQAPLVILADATSDPDAARAKPIRWPVGDAAVPVFAPRKEERAGSLADAHGAQARLEREEHWRLLYVAATRAEERLVVAGALGARARAKGEAPADSWWAAVDRALAALGSEWEEDARWSGARHHRGGTAKVPARARTRPVVRIAADAPEWLRRPAPVEARPPRPLAPSAIGPDDVAAPPPGPAARAAARRGTLLHALFERLPALPPQRRSEAAQRWLETSGGVDDAAERAALAADACAILGDPAFAALFAPNALAEAPIAAVLANGHVVSGTVDRLLVEPDRVRVVDFKTGRRVPADAAAAPAHHLRQMAAYAAALAVIFPDRRIEAALVYTAAPVLLPLPPELLDAHKPSFVAEEQKPVRVG